MKNTTWFHLYVVLSVVKIIETESRMVVAWGWERGEWGVGNGYSVSVLQDEKSSEMDVGDGCSILWMNWILLNCLLVNG